MFSSEKIPVYTSQNGSLTIWSDGFPVRYRSATTKRFLIRNPDPNGQMTLLFDDLVIDTRSKLKVREANYYTSFVNYSFVSKLNNIKFPVL